MKDKSPGRTHFTHVMQHTGQNQVRNLSERYAGIVNGEYDTVPERVHRIISEGQASGNLITRYMTGAFALDAAATMTTDDQEQVDLISTASSNWEFVMESSERTRSPNFVALQAKLGLIVLPTRANLVLFDELPDKTVQQTMYDRLIALAEDTDNYHDWILDRGLKGSEQKVDNLTSLSGFQAELAVVLLHQRFSYMAETLGQLALPSLFSEDHGMHRAGQNGTSSAWDISIFQEDEEKTELVTKIQVKAKKNDHLKKSNKPYADDIVMVYLLDDLVGPRRQAGYSPSWVLRDLRNEYYSNGAEDLSTRQRQKLRASEVRLDRMTDKLLDIVSEDIA